MQSQSQGLKRCASIFALVAVLALGLAPAALSDDWARSRFAGSDAVPKQEELSTMLDARERAMVGRPPALGPELASLDPAIRAAIVARSSVAATPTPEVRRLSTADEGFAWDAAAVGLGVGIAAMCALLGCVTLVRSHGRLGSV